ncbi:MAG: Rpn family recombination-promoting nuclease/putative transposase [Bacteroidales bacterium]|nr:Rpn family recombination-promoting nuclease/putative transposase [Bacteroidales bacterium]
MKNRPTSKKIDFFEKSFSKNHCLNVLGQRFFDLSVYNFFTRISLRNFAGLILNDMSKKQITEANEEKIFAELLCDFMFKRMFGSEENKDVLIRFLNLILQDVEIEHVDFIPNENLGLTEDDRKAIFDISCTCSDGRTLIIEMQKGYQKHFRERAVFYTSYPINSQGRSARDEYIKEHQCEEDGESFRWDYNLKPIIVVALLNFKFDHGSNWPDDRFHSSYRLREDCTGEVMTEVVRYVFLELGRFKKKIEELESSFDKWLYLLKNMHKLKKIPEEFDTPEFRRLFILAKIGNFTAEEMKQYINSLTNMSDYYNIIESTAELAEKKGREEGRAEGLEKGREEAKLEDARRLKELGVGVDIISQATGLSQETIESL